MRATRASSSNLRPVHTHVIGPPFSLTRAQFVQCLANPAYLNYLAQQKMYDRPEFVAYLGYLQYFRDPQYAKYLQ
jgi:hypothetical protein